MYANTVYIQYLRPVGSVKSAGLSHGLPKIEII